MDTRGYTRLNAALIITTVLVISVLTYQWSTHRELVASGGDIRKVGADTVYTSVQLFPQTIPVLTHGLYALSVTDNRSQEHLLGRFRIDANHQIVDANGRVVSNGVFLLPANVFSMSAARIDILPETSVGSQPIRFMSGLTSGDRATLAFDAIDTRNIAGEYMLATPTDGNSSINERSGVWFGDVAGQQASLTLPALPAGWVYEGWAIVNNQPLTTGRFTGPAGDAFSGFSDTRGSTPRMPGEDFLLDPPVAVFPGLTFPVDIADQIVQVSIEPDIAGTDPTGQGPLGVVLLKDEVSSRADARRLYELEAASGDELPKATLVLR